MTQEEEKLAKIWRLIYGSVRKIQLEDKFNRQLKFESQLNYAELSDDFFFQRMVDLIFQSGVRGVVWQKYEPEIRKEFANYKVKKVAKFKEKDVERMLSNPKMFKNRRKIESCIHNAKEIVKLSSQHGGFSNYIGKYVVKSGKFVFPKPDFIEELKERFRHFGYVNALAFLRYIGVDVVKPDINVRRVLFRLGLIDSQVSNQKTLKQVQEVAEAIARAVNKRIAVIDYGIYMFGSGEFLEHSICGGKPRCEECELKKFCQYYKVRSP